MFNFFLFIIVYNFRFDRFRQEDFNLKDTPHPSRISQIKINRLHELVKGWFYLEILGCV
jgi:hypothetical protein